METFLFRLAIFNLASLDKVSFSQNFQFKSKSTKTFFQSSVKQEKAGTQNVPRLDGN
jgi:hypothetical protein